MIYKYDKNLVATAKALRKNMTPEEKRLWYVFFEKVTDYGKQAKKYRQLYAGYHKEVYRISVIGGQDGQLQINCFCPFCFSAF